MAVIETGDVIAGWTVRERLGGGAMGEVFLAGHPRLPRTDVIKVINPVFADDETYRRRFLREAEAICSLEHPHVVAVRDRGEYRGRLYIAMQHVTGGDLRSVMGQRGLLPLLHVGAIVQQVASALDAAHERGVVHRDVKPENILLMDTPEDEPYVFLADFGISRMCSASTALTQKGDVLATPGYAAPELISGTGSDGHVDQYALGCLAFELLTGQVPFPRESSLAAFFAHIHIEPPDVYSLRSDLPPGLNEVFARVLAKSPDDRYPNCREFAAELNQVLRDSGTGTVRPTGPTVKVRRGTPHSTRPRPTQEGSGGPRRRRLLVAGSLLGVAALVAAIVVVVGVVGGKSEKAPGVTTAALIRPSGTRGGTLQLVTQLPCGSWDPQASAIGDCSLQRLLTRQLVTFSAAPGTRELVPDLATSVPPGVGELTWRYELKPGLQFEDGTPITSDAVKYGIERGFAPELGGVSPYVKKFLKGAQNYRGPSLDGPLPPTSIETPDSRTIVFHLSKPFGEWNNVMALVSSSPVPRGKDSTSGYRNRPLSSGPYKFVSWPPKGDVSLVRNPSWSASSDDVRTALPDSVRLRAINSGNRIQDANDVVSMLRFGEADADLFDQPDPNAVALIQTDPDAAQRGIGTTKVGQTGTGALAVIPGTAPFDNIACRSAVAWALNRSHLQGTGYVSSGPPATRILPPNLAPPDPADPFQTPRSEGDVSRAKADLVACGKPDGFSTTLWTSIGDLKAADAVAADLARVGIRVTPHFNVTGLAAAKAANVGLVLSNYSFDWPSAYSMLAPLVDEHSAIEDPDLRDSLNAGLTASTPQARTDALLGLDRSLREQAYYVPIVADEYTTIYSGRLRNIFASEYSGQLDVARLGVMP